MNRQIVAFIVLAYALSIALSLVVGVTGGSESRLAFGFGVASMFIPAFAVLIVVVVMKAQPPRGWHLFPLKYVPVALVLMPVVMHAVMLPAAVVLWGGLPWASWLTPEADGLYHTSAARGWGVLTPAGLVARMTTNIIVGLAANSTLAFFEEVGWRGWLLPNLMSRMSVRNAVALCAAIWAFWHTPFAISGIHYLPGIPALLIILTLPILTIGAGLVIGWLWVRTESIWMVALAHGALNNWGQYAFKFMGNEGAGGEPRDMLVLAAGGLAVLGVGILLITRALPPYFGRLERVPSLQKVPASQQAFAADGGRHDLSRRD